MRSDAPVPTAFPWPSLCQSSPLVLLACVLGGVLCVGLGELVAGALRFECSAKQFSRVGDAVVRTGAPVRAFLIPDVHDFAGRVEHGVRVGRACDVLVVLVLRTLRGMGALPEMAFDVGDGHSGW